MSKQENGGGYGYTGDAAQSAQRAEAQILERDNPSPSSRLAEQFNADGSVAQLAGQTDGKSTPRPTVHNGQSQIAYDAEEE